MSRAQRLIVVLILNLALVAALVIAGIGAHSLGVLAEGGDYLLDAGGVGLALTALVLSRRPATARRPSGYPNAETIAALVNAGWLLLLEVVVAAVTMAAGALIFGGDTPARVRRRMT